MGGITARTGRLRSVIINNTYPLLYDRGEVRFLRADYFLIIIDNVFFGRRSVRIVSFLSDNYKKNKIYEETNHLPADDRVDGSQHRPPL
nr:MAG TPA: hypothetical protein [Caudoviricetes sp.]